MIKKRWIALYVENYSGVLARIAGLFSAKLYNLNSLTVGPTEDITMSRMTISVICDDTTFEQVKKQLNRFVEVIKVIDLTSISTHTKEIVFIKIKNCSLDDKNSLFQMCQVFNTSVIDYGKDSLILESVNTESRNDEIIKLILSQYPSSSIVRGGSVAICSINMTEK